MKPSQVMFMVKFSPTARNFGYDFVLLVHFLGHTVEMNCLFVVVGNFSPYLFVGSPICHSTTFTARVFLINRTSQATGLSYFLAWGINSCCIFYSFGNKVLNQIIFVET